MVHSPSQPKRLCKKHCAALACPTCSEQFRFNILLLEQRTTSGARRHAPQDGPQTSAPVDIAGESTPA